MASNGTANRIVKPILWVVTIVCVLVVTPKVIDHCFPQLIERLMRVTITTKNEQKNRFQESFRILATGIKEIRRESIEGDFPTHCPSNFTKNVIEHRVVRIGERICDNPDHHGRSWMSLENIIYDPHYSKKAKSKIVVRYHSGFNHSSFGKNIITVDEGSFEWPQQ